MQACLNSHRAIKNKVKIIFVKTYRPAVVTSVTLLYQSF